MRSEILILGPCAAESREQVLEIASAISNLRFKIANFKFIFRAGVWKPRTSPNTFQGAGDEALKWLQEVKATYGIPVATEVATPEHVTKALEAGIDYIWIGARSSATPIVVQSLADSILDLRLKIEDFQLKGIFIKNPVNADAKLWLGNIERLEKSGVPVMAIHRGCNHQPCWRMAHEVRIARPDIPMLLDPSHMSGDASKVPALMGKIPELGLDGAMIEVHTHPESALSDQKQQISPKLLPEIIPFGVTRPLLDGFSRTPSRKYDSERVQSPEEAELAWLRAEIDELDEQLWDTIAARMDVSKRIGAWKKAHGVAPLQPERVKVISERLRVTGYRLHLSDVFMQQIWEQIHKESLRQQE